MGGPGAGAWRCRPAGAPEARSGPGVHAVCTPAPLEAPGRVRAGGVPPGSGPAEVGGRAPGRGAWFCVGSLRALRRQYKSQGFPVTLARPSPRGWKRAAGTGRGAWRSRGPAASQGGKQPGTQRKEQPGPYTPEITSRERACLSLPTTDLCVHIIYLLPGKEICQNNLHEYAHAHSYQQLTLSRC